MSELYTILYLDDEEDNLTSFRAVFRRFYHVYTANNADEAMEILEKSNINLVISDQRMPGITGVQFLEKVYQSYPDTIRMILTGYSDMQAIIDAINKGRIYYYITKPWKFDTLKIILDNALESYALKLKNTKLEDEKKSLIIKTLRQEKEQIFFQHEILKNQINPHFLFNCLNTLVSLIGDNQEQAITFTTRFSRLYRQVLEHGEQVLISLDKEVDLIKNYIFLQQIRFGKCLDCKMEITDYSYSIPTFALQLLVENAIKHNVISETHPLQINLDQDKDIIKVSNKIQNKNENKSSSGIGLKNLTQRYKLHGVSNLEIIKDEGYFTVVLPLLPLTNDH